MSDGKNDEGRPGANGSAFEDHSAREANTVPDYAVELDELGPVREAGFQIIRLHPGGKVPDQPWKHSAGLSAAKIARYACEHHNFGVKLKMREPGVYELIVDCDPRNYAVDVLGDPVDTIEAMKKSTGIDLLAEARAKVRTGSGGWHLYFLLRVPEGSYALDTAEGLHGIDFKSAAGKTPPKASMAVAPGSVHGKSAAAGAADPIYRVVAGSDFANLSFLPAPIADMIVRPIPVRDPSQSGGGEWSPELLAYVLEHVDAEAFSHQARVAGVDFIEFMMGCHHATGGDGREEFLDWAGTAAGYVDHRWIVGRRWDSFDAAHPGGIGTGTVGMVVKAVMGDADGARLLAEVANRIDLDSFTTDPTGDVAALLAPSATKSSADTFDWAEALWGSPAKPVEDGEIEYDADGNLLGFGPFRTMAGMRTMPKGEYLVEGMIRKRGVNSIVGPSGSWKTYLASTLALFAANGRAIPTWNLATMECLVVYVTPETPEDFPGKLAALMDAHGDLSDEHFLMVPGVLKMEKPPEVEEVVALLRMAVEITRTDRHILLVIDTFHANCSADGDSNKGDDVQKFINNLKAVNTQADCTSLFVHHTGKDVSKGALGSIAFYNGVDTQLLIRPRPPQITGSWDLEVETAKLKGAKKQPRGHYKAKMRDVEVSRDLNPNGTELVFTPLPITQPKAHAADDFPTEEPEPEQGQTDAPAKVELSLDGMIAAEADMAKPGDDMTEMLDRITGLFPEGKRKTIDRNLVKAIKQRGLDVSKATGFPARRSVIDWNG